MADFDAIVVGAGCAGSVAAYELAKAGKSVLMVERGNFAGAKNMTGGRLYTHSLERVFPDFREDAPLERRITHERVSLMAEDANFTVDFTSSAMQVEGQESYSVLRGPFDQWLASKAEDAGAEAIYGIAVEKLVKDEGGRVLGVKAGEDEITAEVVVLCDGANSLLSEQAVGAKRPAPKQMAVGIKQIFELPINVIEDRVLANEGDGAAWLFAGDATKGTFGGGFMYTNKESISLGIVAGIEATMNHGKTPVYQMMEDLKSNPAVAPLIKGAKMVEHSGHMIPEAAIKGMPERLVADGVLIAGDNAMMCVNLGYQVRGMDYAIAAGQIAGQQAAEAIDAGDTSAAGLSRYVSALEESFVMKDLRQFKNVPAFMEGFTRMFDGYPQMLRDVMNGMFIVDGSPVKPMKQTVMPAVKGIGIVNILKDARGAMKAL